VQAILQSGPAGLIRTEFRIFWGFNPSLQRVLFYIIALNLYHRNDPISLSTGNYILMMSSIKVQKDNNKNW
jgi:hypothetical protein